MDSFPDISKDLRNRVHYLRYAYFEGIEQSLLQLEQVMNGNGIEVMWAPDEESLCSQIIGLLPKKEKNRVCFDMENVPAALNEEESLVGYEAERVANREAEAENLVVESNFAIVEDGSLVFLNRSANNCLNMVENIIVVVRIDQVLNTCSDLTLVLSLLADGNNKLPSDIKILSKPIKKIKAETFSTNESLGYTEENVKVTAIFYENGISNILQDVNLREALYCIHCGRCLKSCPVASCSHHLPPIQIVKDNCLDKNIRSQSIFGQTTLCGMCQEVCPVDIPLTDLLTYEMNIVKYNSKSLVDTQIKKIFSKRSNLNKMSKPFFRTFFTKAMFGKNKQLYNYFKGNKNVFYSIEEEGMQAEEKEDNGIL